MLQCHQLQSSYPDCKIWQYLLQPNNKSTQNTYNNQQVNKQIQANTNRHTYRHKQMQQLVPLQYIKQHFKIRIIKLTQINKMGTATYYHAVTDYGSMTFIIEHYEDTINGIKTTDYLCIRNKLINKQSSNFPLIYQQQVCINHPQQIVCLTLTEQCQILKISEYLSGQYTGKYKGRINKLQKIIKCGQLLQTTQLGLDCKYGYDYFIATATRNQLAFDFTRIIPVKHTFSHHNENIEFACEQKRRYYQQMFKQIVKCIIAITQKYYQINQRQNRIKQIIFVKDRIYKYVPVSLLKAQDYFQVSFYLNISAQKQVEVDYKPISNQNSYKQPSCAMQRINLDIKNTGDSMLSINSSIVLPKTKLLDITCLEGTPTIIHKKKQYTNLVFYDGKCVNCLQELFYKQMLQKFIVEGVNNYRLYRTNLVCVKAKQQTDKRIKQRRYLHQKKQQMSKFQQNQRVEIKFIVYPNISKVELIHFMIAYFNCIEPIISAIIYDYNSHVLSLYLQNKHGKKRKFTMVFYKEYIIKDQQISIIIQKSKIRHCKLDIRFLKVNDAFLYFLSNSEKMLKIQEIYLSDCDGLSQSGLNSFLISPYCKNLHTLSIISSSNIFDTAIQAINKKSSLKNLTLIRCNLVRQSQEMQQHSNNSSAIDLSKLHFQCLQLRGIIVNIQKMLPVTLKVLKLDQFISIEDMKNIRQLQLEELAVKLYEPIQKKSLFNTFASQFTSTINTKTNPLKLFSQGESAGTLKKLDLSGSTIKFKIMKPLFFMKNLQHLTLSECSNLNHEIEPIPPSILHLCLQNNPGFAIQNLYQLLEHVAILIQLNIANTKINKNQLLQYLSGKDLSPRKLPRANNFKGKRIHINNLILSENQYSNKLLERNDKTNKKTGFQGIQNVQVFINRMLNPDQQHILNYMLYKVSLSHKTLRLSIKQKDTLQSLIEERMNKAYIKQNKHSIDQQPQVVASSRNQISKQNTKDVLIQKISKYLQLQSSNINKFKNLYIGDVSLEQVFFGFTDNPDMPEQQQILDYGYLRHLKAQISPLAKFSPRLKLPKNRLDAPIDFIISPRQTIDKITNKFVNLIKNHPQITNPINIYMCNNKIVDQNIIKMLVNYGSQRIRCLDFRGCLFKYEDVIQQLFSFMWIEEINSSQYQIILNKDNFIANSQRYLKLFMRILPMKSLKISIEQTQEVQILYSVLYHIIDQHSATITSFTLYLKNVKINKESEMFLQKVFELTALQHLDLTIIGCNICNEKYYTIWSQGINNFDKKLKKLRLEIPSFQYPHIKLKALQSIQLNFSEINSNQITQNNLHKIIRHLNMSNVLKSIKINLQNCHNISNLAKIFGSGVGVGNGIGATLLERINHFETFSLNLEYCPLRQSSLFQFITNLNKCEKLCTIQLNASFAINNLNQLLSSIQSLLNHAERNINMRVICVTQNSNNFVFNREQMCQNGVQFIL